MPNAEFELYLDVIKVTVITFPQTVEFYSNTKIF